MTWIVLLVLFAAILTFARLIRMRHRREAIETRRAFERMTDETTTKEVAMPRKPKFEVYRARDGWRWRLRSINGRVIATGEAHGRKRDAERAVHAVRTTAPLAEVAEA